MTYTIISNNSIAIPHVALAKVERAIVVNEHAIYSAHEAGNYSHEGDLRLEQDLLLREWFTRTGHAYHCRQDKTLGDEGKEAKRPDALDIGSNGLVPSSDNHLVATARFNEGHKTADSYNHYRGGSLVCPDLCSRCKICRCRQ